MKQPSKLLVVENEPKDLQSAAETAKLAGFSEIEARTSPQAARAFLEDRMAEGGKLPDGIVLDLDFGFESGYELLRLWHSTPELRGIPVIVWSILGDDQKNMCNLFKIKQFVGKWESREVLKEALQSIVQSLN